MVKRYNCKLLQLLLAAVLLLHCIFPWLRTTNHHLCHLFLICKLQYHLRVNNHSFKQTTMAIIIVIIFGKTVNFQHFATLEPGVRFHFPKWQSESNNTRKYYAIPCNHELPSIPNPCNTIDNHWITLNTKGGGSTGLGLRYYSDKVDIHLSLPQ